MRGRRFGELVWRPHRIDESVLVKVLRGLDTGGERSVVQSLEHPRAEETDEGSRFRDGHVTE